MKKTPINPLKMSTKKDDKKKDKKDDDDSAISITPKRKRSASERRRSLAEIIKMKVKNTFENRLPNCPHPNEYRLLQRIFHS